MEVQFHRFFNTHSIYITLDDDKIYQLNKRDLAKELVSEIPQPSKENPIMVIHKSQFDMAKSYLMDINNPFRISVDTARDYRDIGFLSEQEFRDYEKSVMQRQQF